MKADVHPSKATAVNYGLFVQAAYDMYDADPTNLNPPKKNIPAGYDLVLTIQMSASDNREFIGFFARSQDADRNAWVAAFRGSRTLTDASVDADYYLVPFDDKKPKEMVPRGACDFYRTMTVMARG